LVRAQLAQIERDGLKLGRVIPGLFHRNGKRIPYETLLNNWKPATRAAGYARKLMYDFRRTAATRMDSTPGISISVAMSLLGHRNDIMFRRYSQKHGDRLVEAAAHLAKRSKELWGAGR